MVSGASKGIGLAIAHALAAEGMHLSVCARGEAELSRVAAGLVRKYAIQCTTTAADLSQAESIERWVANTIEDHGRIDLLVNNAGAAPPGSFEALTDEHWQSAFAVKPFAYIRASRGVLPHLRDSRGAIVNIVGLAGHQPLSRFHIGGAADAALINFTKGLANEVAADGVRVNAISPGFTRTERWDALVRGSGRMMQVAEADAEQSLLSTMPLGRPALPHDIANAVVFLASPLAAYITGVNLPVDGGATHGI